MNIQQNISLRNLNTFGIDVVAENFAAFHSIDDIAQLLEASATASHLVLGGGSNILLTKNISGFVFKNEIKNIDVVKEDDAHVYVRAGSGENWHSFVMYCVDNGFAGLENLSLIPGTVGASPMQNIGAYGVEIKDVFDSLEAFNVCDKRMYTFTAADCEFGYRESIFKRRYKDQFIITSVCYKLDKEPVFRLTYGGLQQQLESMNVGTLSIKAVSDAVVAIRSQKLPDPKHIGNAGSFFKNPVVSQADYGRLKKQYASMPAFAANDGSDRVKLAAAWLIEQCGWKGFRKGDAGCHAKQALVLVNYGCATGSEILELAENIIASVHDKFGIMLEKEVNII